MATKNDDAANREDEIRAQIDALRADLEKLTEQLLRAGGEQANRVVDDARKAGARVVDEARGAVESGRAYGEQQVEGAEQWIRRNPILAVACALGAGFVIAHLRGKS